jgi:hypothetical protein
MHALEPVLIAAIIVFVLNATGSFIEFNNRFVNALVDTVLFAIVFGAFTNRARCGGRRARLVLSSHSARHATTI